MQKFCASGKCCRTGCSRAQVSMEFVIAAVFVVAIFGFGIFLFEQRSVLNIEKNNFWSAEQVAQRFSRNMNNIYLMDDNSSFSDYIYWYGNGKSVELGARTVKALWSTGRFVDAPLSFDEIDWLLTDVNGKVLFMKQNGRVIVRQG